MSGGSAEFPLTRADALARWHAFLATAAGRYAGSRNLVVPGHPHVSRVSPAVRMRVVTEDELSASVLARHPLPRSEKLLAEIDWRRYFKGWLEQRPGVFRDWRARVTGAARPERCTQIEAGESGVAVMDRFAHELVETGYLHNHARMWFASFWIHVERLPWELGADFFYRHLLDADPASNTLSWRWVAGLHTRGKPYLVRRSNIEKLLACEGLDPRGLARLEDGAVRAAEIDDAADLALVPLPALPSCPGDAPGVRTGLWLHGDDLAPEASELADVRFDAAAAFLSGRLTGAYGMSAARLRALETGLDDGVRRAARHFGCLARLHRVEDLARGLAAWARDERLGRVVAHAPFVGPLGDAVPAVRSALVSAEVDLVLVRRASDTALFPHARGGFFGYWERAKRRFETAPRQRSLFD